MNQIRKLRRRDLISMPHLLLRAVWELARARLRLRGIGARDIDTLNLAAAQVSSATAQPPVNAALVARIGFLITFAARYLPWRSDCLPQAMAAQRWLEAKGIPSEIKVGVELPEDGQFGAHAWLVQGDDIVTGGDVARFTVLGDSEPRPNRNASGPEAAEK